MGSADLGHDEALAVIDDDGNRVGLTAGEALTLFGLTDGLEAATVSACPDCRSRVVAVVALIDLLDAGPLYPRADELLEFADAAPTLHVYVDDVEADCEHADWLDPGYTEWAEIIAEEPAVRRPTP